MQIQDAPWIREAERWGAPPYDDPVTTCPVCGRDCETIYSDMYGDAVGCDKCLLQWDSGEWHDEHDQKEEEP